MHHSRTATDLQVLAAARRIIARHGPVKLTLAAVAREARLSPAALVRRFGSKHRLLVAVAAQAVEDTAAAFAAASGDLGDTGSAGETDRGDDTGSRIPPLVALDNALASLTEPVRDRAELANYLAFLQLAIVDPELRVNAQAQADTLRRGIHALLAEAVRAGDLAPGTDTATLAHAVQATWYGALITWAFADDGELTAALRADVDRLLAPYRTQPPQ